MRSYPGHTVSLQLFAANVITLVYVESNKLTLLRRLRLPEVKEIADPLLERCTFPSEGSHLDCAVSGGPDSVALLILAVHAGCRVTAIHVDHGIREGSENEAGLVRDIAHALGAEFKAMSVQIGSGPNLEARAREARFSVLPPGVATGHTMDDQAETVMIALLRGSGMDGIAAMRSGIRHPLLNVRRSETVKLCNMLGITTFDDPTNMSDSFQRNRVRHHLIPLCCDIAGRDVVPLLARHAQLMAEESQLLDELSMSVDPTDVKSIRSADRVLARRAIRRWLRSGDKGYPPDQAGVERVLAVANGLFKGTDVIPGIHVSRSKGILSKSDIE